jgi:hypothetical protein
MTCFGVGRRRVQSPLLIRLLLIRLLLIRLLLIRLLLIRRKAFVPHL